MDDGGEVSVDAFSRTLMTFASLLLFFELRGDTSDFLVRMTPSSDGTRMSASSVLRRREQREKQYHSR